MDQSINQKTKNILKDLRIAHQKSEKFYAKELIPGRPIETTDIFEMALAFDNEDRILIDLDLTYSKKHPDRFTPQTIKYLKEERKRLTHRIRAWQHRQFPSRYKE